MDRELKRRKSVLMFCANFFGYDKRISDALRAEGFDVDLVEEKPGSGFFDKACIRYNVGLYRPAIRKYIMSVIAQNDGKKYDYVLVVKGEAINEEALALLRGAYSNATFILYLWDSVANIPDCEKRMKLYDRVLTFDPQDAKTYNILFRPLFFMEEYEVQHQRACFYEYDFAFIGTAHTIRPKVVKQIGQACAQRGGAYYSYLFLPHPMVYVYNKVLNRHYRGISKQDINFNPMDAGEIKAVYEKSRSVLDVEHQKQRGLTMRTIELVGMQKKMITTNPSVRQYDFYNPNNICVIDRENPVVDEAFWDGEYEAIDQEILRRYSLNYFVREIMDMKENADER